MIPAGSPECPHTRLTGGPPYLLHPPAVPSASPGRCRTSLLRCRTRFAQALSRQHHSNVAAHAPPSLPHPLHPSAVAPERCRTRFIRALQYALHPHPLSSTIESCFTLAAWGSAARHLRGTRAFRTDSACAVRRTVTAGSVSGLRKPMDSTERGRPVRGTADDSPNRQRCGTAFPLAHRWRPFFSGPPSARPTATLAPDPCAGSRWTPLFQNW